MVFDPAKRITVEEALKHPYLAALHFPEDEVFSCYKFILLHLSQLLNLYQQQNLNLRNIHFH